MKRKIFILLIEAMFYVGTQFALADIPTDHLIAYYPFNGNANDESGNSHHATAYNATLTSDRFGISNKAYYFDGDGDYIDLGAWQTGGGNVHLCLGKARRIFCICE